MYEFLADQKFARNAMGESWFSFEFLRENLFFYWRENHDSGRENRDSHAIFFARICFFIYVRITILVGIIVILTQFSSRESTFYLHENHDSGRRSQFKYFARD